MLVFAAATAIAGNDDDQQAIYDIPFYWCNGNDACLFSVCYPSGGGGGRLRWADLSWRWAPTSITLLWISELLFVLFRAADAINGYDIWAELLQSMHVRLRDFVLDIVMYVDNCEFYAFHQECVIALVVQVHLCFLDTMLGQD